MRKTIKLLLPWEVIQVFAQRLTNLMRRLVCIADEVYLEKDKNTSTLSNEDNVWTNSNLFGQIISFYQIFLLEYG